MKLFIAGFPNDFDDADLKEMFELYGAVKSAGFVTDRATGKSKGFGNNQGFTRHKDERQTNNCAESRRQTRK